jgi:hypothetical protein
MAPSWIDSSIPFSPFEFIAFYESFCWRTRLESQYAETCLNLAFWLFTIPSGLAQPSRSPNPTTKVQYDRGMNALRGAGSSKDILSEIEDIRRAAEAGYTLAQTSLAYFDDNGMYVSQNSSEAIRWYKKAAATDDAVAQFGLGRAYYMGSGTSRDLNEAKVWLTKAADNGYPQANYLIGRLMETLDYTAAPESYRKAAEIGFPLAQYRLGLALASGRGIPIDRTEAYIWLLLSLEAHVDQAATPMSDLESFMGTSATESAKTRARELENTVTRAAHASSCQGWVGELDEVPTVPPPELRKFCP